MAISNTTKTKLNKMNRASADAQLGTVIQSLQSVVTGSLSVTTAQMSASAVVIYDALSTLGIQLVNISRSGSWLAMNNAFKYSRSGGSLTIMPVNSGSFNAGDVVNYLIA